MATWAVGDLQGCRAEFDALLAAIEFNQSRDRLWLVGDVLNRGPDSLGTLRRVVELDDACQIVLGNHDLHFLAVFYGGHEPRRSDTLGELLAAPDVEQLAGWLRAQPLVHHSAELGWLMVHAGVPPLWSLEQLLSRAAAAREFYAGAGGPEFFAGMYGNTPDRWHAGLQGLERVRCIVNYLTRMRLVAADGTLDFANKGAPDSGAPDRGAPDSGAPDSGAPDSGAPAKSVGATPVGMRPWFARSRSSSLGAKVAFGHWASLEGETPGADDNFCAALDTGCVWGRTLTALCLETNERVAVPAQKHKGGEAS